MPVALLRAALGVVDAEGDAEGEEAAELALDPADSVLSAEAVGAQATNAPTPNAMARAPTRPTERAWPEASRLRVGSVLRGRCVVTVHHFLSTYTVRELAVPAGCRQ